MWLTNRPLAPDFMTIADFRRVNGAAIRGTCRQFVMLCRQMVLLSEVMVAIDGTQVQGRERARQELHAPAKLQHRIEQIEGVARYNGRDGYRRPPEERRRILIGSRRGSEKKIERLKGADAAFAGDLQIAVKPHLMSRSR